MLSFDPVAAEFPGFSDNDLATHCGTIRRQIQRWRRHGVTVRRADELAIKIGRHPLEVWGSAWVKAEDEVDRLNSEAELCRVEMAAAKIVRNRDRKRGAAEERRAWKFMESRWGQWAAQWDRNVVESAERATGAEIRALS